MTRKRIIGLMAILLSESLVAGTAYGQSEADIRERIKTATKGFKDLQMDTKIAYSNEKELAKIGKDFGQAYKFKNSRLSFKAPDKFKMSAKAGFMNVSYIVTSDIKKIRAGVINKTENIAKEPHKRQTILDAGLVNDSLWDFYTVERIHNETYNGKPVLLIQLSLSNSPDKKQYVWVNPKDYRMLVREKKEADGSLIVRYIYSGHKEFAGVWVPSEVRAYNENSKLAGTSLYSNIRVNKGISDDEFK